jgi:alpha-beta hydrolase superfamily lysophospholipase
MPFPGSSLRVSLCGSSRRPAVPLPGHPGRLLAAGLVVATLVLVAPRPVSCQTPKPAPPPSAAEQPPGPERLRLPTSDGVQLVAWYYPVPKEPKGEEAEERDKPPVAILVHDLDGSHTSVEPLARALQQRGIAVVAPDLRGHGESVGRLMPAGATEKMEPKLLKKPDFEAMARTGGGRVRDQATIRGDLETVRNWIKKRGEADILDFDRLFVIGSGLGAGVAMAWVMEDAKWPSIATGPQGRQVRGLVLVSPTWATRGFSIAPILGDELIRRELPLLLIAGAEDRDTVKLFDQLKRQRPTEWYDKRGRNPAATGLKAESAESGAKKRPPPTLYLLQLDLPLERDRLASWVDAGGRGTDPAALIAGFITTFGAKAAAE